MQEKRPDFPRRSASFNPEAETFSPAPAKIGAADIDTKLTPRMNSPQRLSVLEIGPSVPQLAGTQSDQLDMSFPDFHDMLHALNQAGNKAAQNPSTPMESIHIAAPYQSRCVEPTQRYAPSFSAPEVEELSTSLGLPGIVGKGKAGADDSTARPSNLPDFKSPASSNLHGKLMGRALAFRHPRRFSDLQSAVQALQQKSHANRLPPKRVIRPRATTRTKRSDQGPEPSSADIYPDDAPYPSTRRPSYVPDPTLVFHDYSSHGRSFKPQDTTSWPTPAEVYSENPIQGPAHPSSSAKEDTEPGFDLFKDHYYPTDADIHEPDAEIDALLKAIPHLLDLHVPELKCDSCPLTPGQTDGSRYGMRFHGIGLGDRWMGPDLSGDPNIKVLW
ncbi:hypothetical protein COCC4DRAFT_186460 [Bipolaris maydis ATCC 48331]|uniref:Uncharacterized protein n=2 Tax=Cochliobolus heterostrophus TaxID=5016 RepID=M2US10_COCH5|nr:uncharacterized protein COCC4DRAFT_186460 [Bipolaris maydis ATCC 48331]EMD90687.1 hypothetical protein COCHEDRAFT_1140386 [Bipolaris maydis C5]ENI09101.1 hypothetical protein COCC4DRAFT_186460 [Bipolaris maydis ATCC 48331]KAJ6206579.1 hypothetical protein PSV09DRAFT_1140386 [Bipolaris maydis]